MRALSIAHPARLRLLARFLCTPAHREVIMPKVSPTMTHGRLIAWKKAEGEAFEEGEDIADIESDKATMPISAREDGFMARIFVAEDTPDIPLGKVLAITVEEEEDIHKFKDYQPPADEPDAAAAPPSTPTASPRKAAAGADNTPSREYVGPRGPAIMRLLNEFPTLDLGAITPTGPHGRLLKGDVLAAIDAGTAFSSAASAAPVKETGLARAEPVERVEPATPAVPDVAEEAGFTDVSVSSMRRAIARRLLQSKTSVPHRYASATYSLDALLALRKRLNATEPSPRISVNDFMMRAVAVALRRVPEMNVRWDEGRREAVTNEAVDVSMAVAVEGGLITPIVRGADGKGLAGIAEKTKELVEKARAGQLEPEEYEGGGFSLTNLGSFGVKKFSAIINPPQSGILAVGSGVQQAVIQEDGSMATVTQGIATLSSDARIVEEETAAKFLDEFSRCMSNPETMLM